MTIIDEIKARYEAAMDEHPGPWWWDDLLDPSLSLRLFDGSGLRRQILKAPRKSSEISCYWPPKATAEFIAAAPSDIATLLEEIALLRTEKAEYVDAMDAVLDRERETADALVAMQAENDALKLAMEGLRGSTGLYNK